MLHIRDSFQKIQIIQNIELYIARSENRTFYRFQKWQLIIEKENVNNDINQRLNTFIQHLHGDILRIFFFLVDTQDLKSFIFSLI